MNVKVNEGKLYLNGKKVDLVNDGCVLVAENIFCSSGALYVNEEYVYQFSVKEFNELLEGAS